MVMVAPEAKVKVPVVAGSVPQLSVWGAVGLSMAHLIPVGTVVNELSMLQLTPVPAGSRSLKVVPVEAPGPPLAKVTVKPIWLPALTVALSAVLVSVRLGHWTVVVAMAGSGGVTLLESAVAVLVYSAQLSLVVELITCTVMVAPEAKVKVPVVAGSVPQLSVWGAVGLSMAHLIPVGTVVNELSMLQLTPVPAGSRSLKVVPVEAPGPALAKVTVKPIWLPALTVALSAVLVSVRLGHWTVVVAMAGSGGVTLLESAVAVLVYSAQLSLVVELITCTVMVAPEAKVKVPVVAGSVPQLSVWGAVGLSMAHLIPVGTVVNELSMLQLTPVPAGSRSLKVVPVEAPGPALAKVTVKPIWLPALTVALSAVLVSVRLGHWTVVVAMAGAGGVGLGESAVAGFT